MSKKPTILIQIPENWVSSSESSCNNLTLSTPSSLLMPLSSPLSESAYVNLVEYRSKLLNQMREIQLENHHEKSQISLLAMKIKQASTTLNENADILKRQIQHAANILRDTQEDRATLQKNNLLSIKEEKKQKQRHDELLSDEKKIKIENIKIKTEVEEIKSKQLDCLKNQIKSKTSDLSILKKQQFNLKKSVQDYQQKQSQIEEKTQREMNESEEVYFKILQFTDKLEQTEHKINRQKVQIIQLNVQKQNLTKQLGQLNSKSSKIQHHLQKSLNNQNHMQKQQESLSYEIKVTQMDIENQQKGIQKEQQLIVEQLTKLKQNQIQLSNLKIYAQQLIENQNRLFDLVSVLRKKDLQLAGALINRVSQSQKPNFQTELKATTRSSYWESIQQRRQIQRIPTINRSESCSTLQNQSKFIPSARNQQKERPKFAEILENQDQFINNFQVFRKKQMVRSQSNNVFQIDQVDLKKDFLEQTASSNNFRSMPKQVSDIITKYRSKQNFKPSSVLLSLHQERANQFQPNGIRTNILNKLTNYRPTANNWLNSSE